jgi:hypothetical protein
VNRGVPFVPLLAIGVLTFLALFVSGGEIAAVAAPVVAACLIYVEWRAPLRLCVPGLMFFSLIADAPQDNPMGGLWHSPLYALGQLLCDNWSKTFAIAALPFSGMDLLCLMLLVRVAARRAQGYPPGGSVLVADVLWKAMAAFLATVVLLGVVGAWRGGQMDTAYWQVRQLIHIPAFAFLLAEALEETRDHQLFAPIVLAAALIKTAVGLYFHFVIAVPRGLDAPYVTTHSDTLLFCLSLALVTTRWLEQPDWPSLRRMLWFVPPVMVAVWLNNRRIAYVGLAGIFLLVWQFTRPNGAKRTVARMGLLALPLIGAYLVAGWRSPEPVFKPVASIRTIVATPDEAVSAADSSTRSRDIENFNLGQTLRLHPLGTGLGQEYEEVVQGPDISADFALYRYIPHNSVLWMLTAAGPIGFFLLWSVFTVGVYLAARSYRFARHAVDRISALAALCTVLLFLVQAWGDMGTQNWSTTWLLAAALVVAGKLAVLTGAWPSSAAPSPGVSRVRTLALEPTWIPSR